MDMLACKWLRLRGLGTREGGDSELQARGAEGKHSNKHYIMSALTSVKYWLFQFPLY